jgi:hypothetical protein
MAQMKSPFGTVIRERYEREKKLRARRRIELWGGEELRRAKLREIALLDERLRSADPREEACL